VKKLPKAFVDKKTALEVLRDHGPLGVEAFAEQLRKRGKNVRGPRKAFNVLQKLLVYSLVRRNPQTKTLHYKVGEGDGAQEIERNARVILWELTDQGERRLEYLLTKTRR
jgi:repressor of nif and glnA expression